MIIFFDTSSLVKYFHQEKGSNAVKELIEEAKGQLVISELARLEFISALHRRARAGEIHSDDLKEVIKLFQFELSRFRVQPVNRTVIRIAEALVIEYGQSIGLRTLDAIHLATPIMVPHREVIFVATDDNLLEAAEKIGYKTFYPA